MENDLVLLDIRFALSICACYNMVGFTSEDWGDFFGKVHSSGGVTNQGVFGIGVLVEGAERMENGTESIAG